MQKIFHTDSYCREITTKIRQCRNNELLLEELLFHPSGGGQPDDTGSVIIEGITYPVLGLRKEKGESWVQLPSMAPPLAVGDTITCTINWERRFQLMRLHSCAHVIMASAKKLVAGYIPKGMQTSDDISSCTVTFTHAEITQQLIEQIMLLTTQTASENRQITAHTYQTLDAARAAGGELFRMDPAVLLRGAVRIVTIDGYDFNPCGGTHLRTTGEIGQVTLCEAAKISTDLCSLRFTVL
jgi:Ser-tRNA(Ala) deacylase AlaX